MLYFRFYLRDMSGDIVRRESAYCVDEAEARAKAREFCKVHDIEIWQGTTKVGVMNCTETRPSSGQDRSAIFP
jgi:hypothetical protein